MSGKICFKISQWSLQVIWVLCTILSGADGISPDVSQEGILRPYKSYSDATLLHYSIPSEVTRVTWEFAAFMDSPSCPAKDVHIYIQHGSYPLIDFNSSSFPPNAYIRRTSLHYVKSISSFELKSPTIFPVNNPLPGNWYAAAYISDWDTQLKQEGFSHKCHYSLGSVAVWSQVMDVPVIIIGSVKKVVTTEAYSYFKFYIPSGIWSLSLNITNCTLRVRTMKAMESNEELKLCIKYLSLRSRALPPSNSKESMVNVTESSGYTIVVPQPNTECYYYLLVVSDAEVSFNIEVLTEECKFKALGKNYFKRLDHMMESFKVAALNNRNSSTSESRTTNVTYSDESMMGSAAGRNGIGVNFCPSIFRLSRVKNTEEFSNTFLLQAYGRTTRWISLNDFSLLILQLEILPFIDIGGTLSIGIHLDDLLLNATDGLVAVTACVNQGTPPKILSGNIMCPAELQMKISSSNVNTTDSTILVPYPEPDTWYIAFQTGCFLNGSAVPCSLDVIMVELNIRTQRCVFPILPCGLYGICQETHTGVHLITSCYCVGGYSGWGCTDGRNAIPQGYLLLTTLLLTLSNVFFLPAIVLAIRRNMIPEALVYIATMMFSTLYHACDEDFYNYCVTKYEVLQFCDFFFSILAFWVTLIAAAGIPSALISAFHMIGVIIIAIGVEYNRTGLLVFIIPSGLGLSVPLFHWCLRCYKQSQILFNLPSFVKMLPGIILAGTGLILFAFVETENNYQYVHSTWHIVIALALVFLLPRTAVSSDPQSVEAELYSVNDCSSSSPVFVITSDIDHLISS